MSVGNEPEPFSSRHRNKERPTCFLISKDDLYTLHRATVEVSRVCVFSGLGNLASLGRPVSRDLLDCGNMKGVGEERVNGAC